MRSWLRPTITASTLCRRYRNSVSERTIRNTDLATLRGCQCIEQPECRTASTSNVVQRPAQQTIRISQRHGQYLLRTSRTIYQPPTRHHVRPLPELAPEPARPFSPGKHILTACAGVTHVLLWMRTAVSIRPTVLHEMACMLTRKVSSVLTSSWTSEQRIFIHATPAHIVQTKYRHS